MKNFQCTSDFFIGDKINQHSFAVLNKSLVPLGTDLSLDGSTIRIGYSIRIDMYIAIYTIYYL